MKFLCVNCNTQMKLVRGRNRVAPDSRGSLTIRYECPDCLVEFAMLTNPYETQLVSSLGVEIGGKTLSDDTGNGQKMSSDSATATDPQEVSTEDRCPFSQVARDALVEEVASSGTEEPPGGIPWTAQARVRLENVPEFVRPIAKLGIERFAQERGFSKVDEACMDVAKEEFGM